MENDLLVCCLRTDEDKQGEREEEREREKAKRKTDECGCVQNIETQREMDRTRMVEKEMN